MYVLYEVLLYLVLILSLPYFLLMGVLRGKYLSNIPQRMGVYRSRADSHDLWMHAVSVGEVMAAQPVLTEVWKRRPETSVVVTTTTLTGQAQASRLFPQATVTYFPFDFAFSVKRFLDHHRPRVFATMETEIWPNVTRIARQRGLRLLLANGRISDRSFPRYRAFRPVVSAILRHYERILAREETDRTRFIAMGADPERVETTGNVKFDYQPDLTPLDIAPRLERLIGGRPVLILGSTRAGEDEVLLPLIEELIASHGAFVILAPRKAERFELVAGLLSATATRYVRRTDLEEFHGDAEILLLDSFGELSRLYRYATAAFVGGSLVSEGGQNPIEPAAAGVPVCFGPSMTNFREIAEVFLRERVARQVTEPRGVIEFAREIFGSAQVRSEWAGRARVVVQQNRGASERTARHLLDLLDRPAGNAH